MPVNINDRGTIVSFCVLSINLYNNTALHCTCETERAETDSLLGCTDMLSVYLRKYTEMFSVYVCVRYSPYTRQHGVDGPARATA